jgi:hypothetical protein
MILPIHAILQMQPYCDWSGVRIILTITGDYGKDYY